jgi:hypothetical protein
MDEDVSSGFVLPGDEQRKVSSLLARYDGVEGNSGTKFDGDGYLGPAELKAAGLSPQASNWLRNNYESMTKPYGTAVMDAISIEQALKDGVINISSDGELSLTDKGRAALFVSQYDGVEANEGTKYVGDSYIGPVELEAAGLSREESLWLRSNYESENNPYEPTPVLDTASIEKAIADGAISIDDAGEISVTN